MTDLVVRLVILAPRPESIRAMSSKQGYLYIMANRRSTLYAGVTSNLAGRVHQHKHNLAPASFTSRYQLHTLVYYETHDTIQQAIVREKQVKDMNRQDKLTMIRRANPTFRDLYEDIQG